MDIPSLLLIVLWWSSVPVRLAVIAVLVRHRLVRRYPILTAWLLYTTSQTVWFIYLQQTQGVAAYAAAQSKVWTFGVVAYFLIAAECMGVLARHFPNIRSFATALFTVLTAVSAFAAYFTTAAGARLWPNAYPLRVWITANYSFVVWSVITGARAYFAIPIGWRLRHNAITYCNAMIVLFAGQVLGNAVGYAAERSYWIVFAGQVIMRAGTFTAYWMLISGMSAGGEQFSPPPPITPDRVRRARQILDRY